MYRSVLSEKLPEELSRVFRPVLMVGAGPAVNISPQHCPDHGMTVVWGRCTGRWWTLLWVPLMSHLTGPDGEVLPSSGSQHGFALCRLKACFLLHSGEQVKVAVP